MKPNNLALFIGAFFSSQFLKNVSKCFALLWLILLKVDIYATKICIKVGLFSIKSSIYLIFK